MAAASNTSIFQLWAQRKKQLVSGSYFLHIHRDTVINELLSRVMQGVCMFACVCLCAGVYTCVCLPCRVQKAPLSACEYFASQLS